MYLQRAYTQFGEAKEVRLVSAPDGVAADPVRYELRDSGVAVLTLNRPERMNAWGGGLATAFHSCLDPTEADPNVRAVVTGSGRAFCAGADMVKEVVPADELLARAIGYAEDIAASCAEFSGGDQATGVRRHHARCVRGERCRRETDARIDAPAGLHRRHHKLLREASTTPRPSGTNDARLTSLHPKGQKSWRWTTRPSMSTTTITSRWTRSPGIWTRSSSAGACRWSATASTHKRSSATGSTVSSPTRRSTRSSCRGAWPCCSAAKFRRASSRRR